MTAAPKRAWSKLARKILALHSKGTPMLAIAEQLGCTRQYVRIVLISKQRITERAPKPHSDAGRPDESRAREMCPGTVTACPFSDDWWAQNQQSFAAGMVQALREAETPEEMRIRKLAGMGGEGVW